MNCPACGTAGTRVYKSMDDGTAVRRIRKCVECLAKWWTTEKFCKGTLTGPSGRPAALLSEMVGPIRPSVRFAILKRDCFACHYCGRAAPDVVLHVDHVVPRAAGGTNEESNLVAACQECNGGKGARPL